MSLNIWLGVLRTPADRARLRHLWLIWHLLLLRLLRFPHATSHRCLRTLRVRGHHASMMRSWCTHALLLHAVVRRVLLHHGRISTGIPLLPHHVR